MSFLHFDWLDWDCQKVFVIQIEGDSRNDNWLEVWTMLAWRHREDLPLRIFFHLLKHLCIDYLRLEIQMLKIVKVWELRMLGDVEPLQKAVRFLSNLSWPFVDINLVIEWIVMSDLLIIFWIEVHGSVHIYQMFISLQILDKHLRDGIVGKVVDSLQISSLLTSHQVLFID